MVVSHHLAGIGIDDGSGNDEVARAPGGGLDRSPVQPDPLPGTKPPNRGIFSIIRGRSRFLQISDVFLTATKRTFSKIPVLVSRVAHGLILWREYIVRGL
jgi:hypothetical protein